ncbi:MAG: divalent metal cation transporter, partial [candidate division NC10 bacterium]|nr:divalent metal cation transporter [candidate division NC10 bacterium]
MPFPRIRRRRVLLFFSIVGPGIITASVDQDAGGIATYSLAGAHYGTSLLWSLFFITISLAVIQEMGSRMGVVTGKGLAELIREVYGLRLTTAVLVVLVLANWANTVANFAGVAAALEIFGVPRLLSVPAVAGLVAWLVVQGTYRLVERAFLLASTVYIVYVISGLLARPAWGEVLRASVTPTLRLQTDYLTMLIALVGTTIAPWMQFYLQSSVVDKGIRVKEYPFARLDVFLGSLVAAVIAFFIIVACAATLHVHGVRIESAADAALALEPFAGRYATVLFAIGLFNASAFAAAIVPLSAAYAACEALGWAGGVDRGLREAPGFFAIYLALVGTGAVATLWPRAPLIEIMVASQVLNGILLPGILVLMLRLINDREVMGTYVNSPLFNLV